MDERECRWLEGEILYLRFDDFDKGIAEWVEQSLKQSVQAKGLIVDLRWNPGGLKNELDQMAGIVSTGKQRYRYRRHPENRPFYMSILQHVTPRPR